MPLGTSYYDPNSTMNFDDLPLIDFLRDVMTPTPMPKGTRHVGSDGLPLFPRDVLDFNIDNTFEFTNVYSMSNMVSNEQQNLSYPAARLDGEDPSGNRSGYTTPGVRRSISLGTQAFKESIWLWTPAKEDHGYAEQHNLSLPYESVSSETTNIDAMFPYQQLSQATRDSILAMVLSTCEASIYPRVVACFPSAELLTNLLHSFVSFHLRQEISWIHPATLKINEESPEFIGSLICSGAALSRVLELRKLGFAMQEALRLFMPTMVCCSAWYFFSLTLNIHIPVRERQQKYAQTSAATGIYLAPRCRALEWRSTEDGDCRKFCVAIADGTFLVCYSSPQSC
jgi:hypothetical protein